MKITRTLETIFWFLFFSFFLVSNFYFLLIGSWGFIILVLLFSVCVYFTAKDLFYAFKSPKKKGDYYIHKGTEHKLWGFTTSDATWENFNDIPRKVDLTTVYCVNEYMKLQELVDCVKIKKNKIK